VPTATRFPTITPTFDLAQIITRTPSLAAVCPPYDENYLFDGKIVQDAFKNDEPVLDDYLDFLNHGGNPSSLVYMFQDDPESWNPDFMKDLTGDGVPELVVATYEYEIFILGCRNGQYDVFTEKAGDIFTQHCLSQIQTDGVTRLFIQYLVWACLPATSTSDGTGFQPLFFGIPMMITNV
jgi:hypothetical protein